MTKKSIKVIIVLIMASVMLVGAVLFVGCSSWGNVSHEIFENAFNFQSEYVGVGDRDLLILVRDENELREAVEKRKLSLANAEYWNGDFFSEYALILFNVRNPQVVECHRVRGVEAVGNTLTVNRVQYVRLFGGNFGFDMMVEFRIIIAIRQHDVENVDYLEYAVRENSIIFKVNQCD